MKVDWAWLRKLSSALAIAIPIWFCAVAPAPKAAATEIYIDSVPRGAIVKVLPKEDEKGEEVSIGTTPLVVDSSRTPSMRFAIIMMMDDFLRKIALVPELKEWSQHFQIGSIFSFHGGGPRLLQLRHARLAID